MTDDGIVDEHLWRGVGVGNGRARQGASTGEVVGGPALGRSGDDDVNSEVFRARRGQDRTPESAILGGVERQS